jgi:hypothetical protein
MVKATPRQMGIEEIRIPGERGFATRARLVREGIEIERKIHTALGRLAEGTSITVVEGNASPRPQPSNRRRTPHHSPPSNESQLP